jgi:transcriptional regulator with XRE-family HTH domain
MLESRDWTYDGTGCSVNQVLGRIIAVLRQSGGLTQTALSTVSGLSQNKIAWLETGRSRLTVEDLRSIEALLIGRKVLSRPGETLALLEAVLAESPEPQKKSIDDAIRVVLDRR